MRAGETLTPGRAELAGPCLCGGDLWAVPWHTDTGHIVRTIRVCDVCGQER